MDRSHQIRERAYQLWQSRPDSSELENWLAAERELTRSADRNPAAELREKKPRAKTARKRQTH